MGDLLNKFVTTINGKEGTGSHLVTIPPGPHLSDALVSSPIVQGEDGSGASITSTGGGGFEFGVDPNDDPELALALRVSMEEQRARQQAEGGGEAESAVPATPGQGEESSEEALLQRALAMSMDTDDSIGAAAAPGAPKKAARPERDLAAMTEEEQIAYAMQMSMAENEGGEGGSEEKMDVDDKDQDYSEVMNDPAFLQSVLQNLPGVDPDSEAVRAAMGAMKEEKKKEDKKDSDNK